MKKFIIKLLSCFIPSRKMRREFRTQGFHKTNESTCTQCCYTMHEPGHYYSTIPSVEDVKKHQTKEKSKLSVDILGIDLNLNMQVEYLNQIESFNKEYLWPDEKMNEFFYNSVNPMYPTGCGKTLHAMLKIIRPKKIIEIGSGHSTAMMVDTNRIFLDNSVKITCIEPYPCRLHELFGSDMDKYITLHENKLQDVEMVLFDELEDGDILFVDSSHVAKLESDVNKILFEILPRLKQGVIIHIHDIHYPFEYPDYWFDMKIFWNETYILRAFLQYNKVFEIVFWGSCVSTLCKPNYNPYSFGSSIWLRKIL